MITLIISLFCWLLEITFKLAFYIVAFSLRIVLGMIFWPFKLLCGGKSTPQSRYEDALWDGMMIGCMMSDDD